MLILCEKPAVARDFARTLGCSRKDGFFEGAGVVITYCVGHLFELFEPDDYDPALKNWRFEDLPITPSNWRYKINEDVKDQAQCVLRLLKAHAHDDVLIATDAGREGELIARIALQEAGIKDISRFSRFWVSEALTDEVIRSGMAAAKPLSDYNGLCDQGFARSRADWLAGMNLSRFMSIGNPQPPFTVGRVQTAVLAAVAKRNADVQNFTPKPYKELQAIIEDAAGTAVKALLENKETGKTAFFEKDAEFLGNALSQCEMKKVDSVDVKSEQKKQKPEKLFNITGLQKAAYKAFGYSPDETLNIAQALYEKHKCLSYPRTPSRVMGDNNVDLFLEKFNLLKDHSTLSVFSSAALIKAENKHIFNSAALEDHHALIPLASLPDAADEKERNIYNLVLDSFFTVCMPDFIYNEKSLAFHIGEYLFKTKIREVIEKGFKAAKQKNQDPEEKDGVEEIAAFDHSSCKVKALSLLEKKTEPQKEFSIDTLLSFMEKPHDDSDQKLAGLGTPATRAEAIKTLFARRYLKDEKKKLFVSERALWMLGELSKNDALKKITDTAQTTQWEQKLIDDPKAFEKEIIAYVAECVKAASERGSYREEKEALGSCPLCGKPVVEGKLSYSCSGWRDEPKCGFSIWKEKSGAKITAADAKLLLAGKKTPLKKCVSKDKKSFDAFFILENNKVNFQFDSKK
jgi:DNA topoisomerase-3